MSHTVRSRPFARPARVALAAALIAAAACSKPPLPPLDPEKTGERPEPWAAAAARLSKDTEPATAKAALGALSTDAGATGEPLPGLDAAGLDALAALVPLAPDDREEVRGSAFSAHDPVYLADCLYLRDAAKALALTGLPTDQRADRAFEWVCRQVYLQPWLRAQGGLFEATALPPTAVLRRGFGSGLERAYVFLALAQQLGLEACLIGPPDAGVQDARGSGPRLAYPHRPDVEVPRGPFWAVGVSAGADVRLYDPWRGAPVPLPLSQLKANPDAAKDWFADPGNVSKVTPDDARKATAFLAVPVSALSPRVARFEAKLGAQLGVKLAYDRKALEALRAAFPDPKPAFWNPPGDPFAYGRAARSYVPFEMGGADRGAPGARLYEASLRDQIPATAFVLPKELTAPAAVVRLRAVAASLLAASFVEPPNPRERIQRGRFSDAARELVAKQEQYSAGLERLRTQDAAAQTEQINEWIAATNAAFDKVARAELDKDAAALASAQTEVERGWRAAPAQWLVDRASAEVGRAEASLLLALCKHELAERAQVRLARTPTDARAKADSQDAWATAVSAWRTYEQLASAQAGFPGRAEHAAKLSARAQALAAAK